MPQIKVSGLTTFFRQAGEYDPSKQTVLFIHGACQSSLTWEYQFGLFDTYKRFNSVFIDLPGHGESEGNGFRSINDYCDFINEFRIEIAAGNIVIAGHSMGGRICQKFLIKYPEVSTGAILAGTGSRIKITRAVINAIKHDFDHFCKLATENSFSSNAEHEIREHFHRRLKQSNRVSCLNDMLACNEFDVTDDIRRIQVPCLIIAGSEDILAPVKYSRDLYNKIRNSRLEIIEDSGHFMMIEEPMIFNSLLRKFLDFL